jgi:5-methyltetrahydropteroyltriglutamate--homocysteine methyltransferase
MRTTIVGFPRIGKKRELKTLLDSYFKNKINGNMLFQEAASLAATQLHALSEQLDIIPCGDFSLYDGMLDMVYLFGCIPPRFAESGMYTEAQSDKALEAKLALYFAMARGTEYQGRALYPLEMKKWFTTNYHYLVPELSRHILWNLDSTFLEAHIRRATALQHPFKMVLIGPLTFLSYAKILEGSHEDYLEPLLLQYQRVFQFLIQNQVSWVQLDEPILVTDLEEVDRARFRYFYQGLLGSKGSLKVLLQTYFGDIRNLWFEIGQYPFDAIGLDLVAGKQNLQWIQNGGFPKGCTLVAGCIDGRNIWRTDRKALGSLLALLQSKIKEELWLSSSCSLLHVPYTIEDEEKLPEELRHKLAFAWEKIDELRDIKEESTHVSVANGIEHHTFSNVVDPQLFSRGEFPCTPRPVPRAERYRIQQERFALPLLPTTTIGSFPQDEELRRLRRHYRDGKVGVDEYERKLRDRIRDLVALQEELGLDVLVHGEYERNDMVEYFAEHLEGFYTTEGGWVQSYGSRVIKPPIIYKDIRRTHPITVPWIRYAQSITKKPMKAILTGPITIINWSFVREDLDLTRVAFQLARALREEIVAIQAEGISIIQVDEAALREKLPLRTDEWDSYLDLAVAAFLETTASIRPEVQLHTHMCYSEFGSMVKAIEAFDVDVITIEAARSQFELLSSFKAYGQDHQIGPGIYDIHSPLVPTVEELEERIQKILTFIPAEMLWINPDCGLKTRGIEETRAALRNMVEATLRVRHKIEGHKDKTL